MYGMSPACLREDLTMWIDLHLNKHVSGMLLILRHAFEFDRKPREDKSSKSAVVQSLEHMLSGLPDNLVH